LSRNEFDTYGRGRFDYDRSDEPGYSYGRDGRDYDEYGYDRYDRSGRSGRSGRYNRYGAVNREGYGAIGAVPGSWSRNAQDRSAYRQHERFNHPAYEAGRVRRMGINAPGGYANTIRDAQYRKWTRGRDYDQDSGYGGYGYRGGADAYDGAYEGSYEGMYDASRETDAYLAGRRDAPYGPEMVDRERDRWTRSRVEEDAHFFLNEQY
jgi:hypothetical protein